MRARVIALSLMVMFAMGCVHWVPGVPGLNARGFKAREMVHRVVLSPTKYAEAFELEKQCNGCSLGMMTVIGGTVWFAGELVLSTFGAIEAHMCAFPPSPQYFDMTYGYYGEGDHWLYGKLPNDGDGLYIDRANEKYRPAIMDAASPKCCWRDRKGKYPWKKHFPECRKAECKYGRYRN